MTKEILIREAKPEDAEPILACMLLAMADIACKFLETENKQHAADFLLHFICREDNMYSWQNCWVAEKEGKIVAVANVYEGTRMISLREPIVDYIRRNFNSKFEPEDETQAGEFYIDSLGVLAEEQGKGYGSRMLEKLIDEFVVSKQQNLGLLVREGNLGAKKLYHKMGFKPVDVRMLAGKRMEHLQISS